MRKLIITFITVAVCLSTELKAQDATARLNEAESAYTSHNLDNTRFALQGALSEINIAVGKKILDFLPKSFSEMQYNPKDDNVTNGAGFSGMIINRSYGVSGTKSAKIQIMGDSPLLTGINALLAMPFAIGSSQNEKRVKINGYKAIMKKETDTNNVVSFNFQIPVNQTLVTFDLQGISEESTAVSLANTIPVEEIAKTAQ